VGPTVNSFKDIMLRKLFKEYPDIDNFSAVFKVYTLEEYPYPTVMKTLVIDSYKNNDGEYYWGRVKYDTFEDLFNDLKEQKVILELTAEFKI
jgi:hypothetical protein